MKKLAMIQTVLKETLTYVKNVLLVSILLTALATRLYQNCLTVQTMRKTLALLCTLRSVTHNRTLWWNENLIRIPRVLQAQLKTIVDCMSSARFQQLAGNTGLSVAVWKVLIQIMSVRRQPKYNRPGRHYSCARRTTVTAGVLNIGPCHQLLCQGRPVSRATHWTVLRATKVTPIVLTMLRNSTQYNVKRGKFELIC